MIRMEMSILTTKCVFSCLTENFCARSDSHLRKHLNSCESLNESNNWSSSTRALWGTVWMTLSRPHNKFSNIVRFPNKTSRKHKINPGTLTFRGNKALRDPCFSMYWPTHPISRWYSGFWTWAMCDIVCSQIANRAEMLP